MQSVRLSTQEFEISTEGVDEKIDPKVEAAESTPSSSEEVQI